MTTVFTKRLAFLLLLSFSWQSVAASFVDCPSSMSANASANQSEHESLHQHGMHQEMANASSMQEQAITHPMTHHSMTSESAANDPKAALTEHHCVSGCFCDYCGVASLMLENDFNLQLSLLPSSPRFAVIHSIDLPTQEVPFRPPILT